MRIAAVSRIEICFIGEVYPKWTHGSWVPQSSLKIAEGAEFLLLGLARRESLVESYPLTRVFQPPVEDSAQSFTLRVVAGEQIALLEGIGSDVEQRGC